MTKAQIAALRFILTLLANGDVKPASAYVDVQEKIRDRARELLAGLEADTETGGV